MAQRYLTHKSQMTAAAVKRITHEGCEYLIVPDIPIREGVMNGLLYLANEIGAYPEAWNGRPLTLGHPQRHGLDVSANHPDIIAKESPGYVFNSVFDGEKINSEWWLSIPKCNQIGGDALEVINRLEAGGMIEESTGLFADVEEREGSYNGEDYWGIARNIRPDHLAILLHDVGACSIDDGCGAPRVNKQEAKPMTITQYLLNLELSLDDQLNRVYQAFYENFRRPDGDISVRIYNVFSTFVVAMDRDGKLWSYPYAINEESGVEFGDPVQIQIVYQEVESGRQLNNAAASDPRGSMAICDCTEQKPTTSPAPANNRQQPQPPQPSRGGLLPITVSQIVDGLTKMFTHKEAPMSNKEKLIKALLANDKCPLSREVLDQVDEATLQTFVNKLEANDEGDVTIEITEEVEITEAPGEPAAAQIQLPKEITEFAEMIKGLGGVAAIGQALGSLTANAQQERTRMIAAIKGNSRNAFTDEALKGMTDAQLRMLADTVAPVDYSGMGGIFPNTGNQGDYETFQAGDWGKKAQ